MPKISQKRLTAKQQAFLAYKLAHPTATDTEAARAAGYSPTDPKAGHVCANLPAVKTALEAAQAVTMARAGLSLETHLNTLARLRNRAVASEQFGPAVTAEVHRGKAAGLYVERHKVEIERVKAMSDEDVERVAAEMGLV